MIRRKMTLKRVDPWSVLKFGAVVNLAFLLIALLGFWILWFVIGRLGLVDQFCDSVGTIVLDLQECSLNGGNIFRTLLFLGLLGVVVQTGIFVFAAFLYNLISDLTGGLTFSYLDESADPAASARRAETPRTAAGTSASGSSSHPAASSGGRDASGRTTGTSSPSVQRSGQPAPTRSQRPATPEQKPAPSSDRGSSSKPESTPPKPPAEPAPDRSSPPAEPARQRQSGSSGSLWGDPTRTTDRT